MKRAVLLGVLGAVGVATAAYAAVTVTNVYAVRAKITPVKSGTKAHPVAVSTHLVWVTTTSPPDYRPNIVKTIDVRVQGSQEHTNAFPACGTARLNEPTQGPNTCPVGSQIGKGYFIAEITPAGSQKPIALTCRAEISIYNGGDHNLSFYAYKGTPVAGQPQPCPLARNEAWNATLTKTPRGLVLTATLPSDLRHPTVGGSTFDASAAKASFDIPVKTTKITKKGKRVKVGLFETIACPANHQRQLAVKFTQEDGKSRTATRLVTCR